MIPACFDSAEQYAAWVAAARLYKPPERDGYCADCTPEYKLRMRREHRCRYAYTRFVLKREPDGELDLVGMRDITQVRGVYVRPGK